MISLLLVVLAAAAADSPIERLGQHISTSIASFDGPIGVYIEGSSAPLNRAVGSAVMASLANQKRAPVPIVARDANEAERLARAQGLHSLVRLTLSLDGKKIVARGDALSTWVNFWSGATPTRSGPALTLVNEVDADAKTLLLAGTIARAPELSLSSFFRLPSPPAALLVADIDGDRHAEVIVLVREAVVIVGADGKQRARLELTSPLSTRPSREPFGLLWFTQSKLWAWSSRHQLLESWSWQTEGWRPAGLIEVGPLGINGLIPRPGVASFEKEVTLAAQRLSWPEPIEQLSTFDKTTLIVSPSGNAGISPTKILRGIGSGSTLADLDADGIPEVVTTSSVRISGNDELRVRTLTAFEGNETTVLWRHPFEGRAVTASNGDLNSDGSDEVVLGNWLSDGSGELLLLQRVAP